MRHDSPKAFLPRHARLLALLAVCIILSPSEAALARVGQAASAQGGDAAHTGPRFGAEQAYRVLVDPSDLESPELSLTNPHGDRSIAVRVFAWSSRVESHRTVVLHLEAGATSTMTLDGPSTFDRLSIRSDSAFVAELRSTVDGSRRQLPVTGLDGSGFLEKISLGCSGDWTLTCLNCPHGPFTAPGFVLPIGRVYWRLNRPTGTAWETIGDQGILAWWNADDTDCPVTVTNSLGDTYSVYIDPVPPIGPF